MTLFLFMIMGYLMGSIPTGIWIGKYFHNIDIREHGSGNSGSTNAFRVLGKLSGSVVLTIDILKGMLPPLLAMLFVPSISPLLVGIAAIIGHTFPIFAQFKGGKAVATTAGVILAIYPVLFVFAIVLFLLCLYFTRMVSLSSMLIATITTIASFFFYHDYLLTAVLSVLALFIIYRHRANIQRIKNGTENKVPFGYKSKR